MPRLLTSSQAAAYLNISLATFNTLRATNELCRPVPIPAVRQRATGSSSTNDRPDDGRTLRTPRWDRADLDQAIERWKARP